jgi:hypothetical protein
MKSLSHHINRVKSQPHHVRKRVAFGTAFAVAAFVGAAWAGTSLATGAFALHDTSSFGNPGPQPALATAPSGATGLAAADSAFAPAAQPAHIEIVDVKKAPPPAAAPTSIPF